MEREPSDRHRHVGPNSAFPIAVLSLLLLGVSGCPEVLDSSTLITSTPTDGTVDGQGTHVAGYPFDGVATANLNDNTVHTASGLEDGGTSQSDHDLDPDVIAALLH